MGQAATRAPKYWVKTAGNALFVTFVALSASHLWGGRTDLSVDRFLSVLATNYDDAALARGVSWRDQLAQSKLQPIRNQLRSINQFFNQSIRWETDQAIYGTRDFWATPAETLGHGKGDCEDFTIAKYVSLRYLGVPADQLRLTYVQLKLTATRTQAHMVLAWYPKPNAIPLILDNANPRILPASQRKDLKPIFSFNSDELWLGNSRSATDTSPSSRISQWRQMVIRAEREGILL